MKRVREIPTNVISSRSAAKPVEKASDTEQGPYYPVLSDELYSIALGLEPVGAGLLDEKATQQQLIELTALAHYTNVLSISPHIEKYNEYERAFHLVDFISRQIDQMLNALVFDRRVLKNLNLNLREEIILLRNNLIGLKSRAEIEVEKREAGIAELLKRNSPTVGPIDSIEATVSKLELEMKHLSRSERTRLLSQLADHLGLKAEFDIASPALGGTGRGSSKENNITLPAEAPELWVDRRRDSNENPADFVVRVYKDWLDLGLGRSHIRELDRPLYQALATWLRRNKSPRKLDKFMKVRALRRNPNIDHELAEYGIVDPTDAFDRIKGDRKTAERLYAAALRRQLRHS